MPTEDVVADLYDGFLRRADDPDVREQVARDVRMRHEERQPHQVAARRVSRGGLFRALTLPTSRHDAVLAVGFWVVVGVLILLQIALWPGLGGMVCLTFGLVIASLAAMIVWRFALNLSPATRPTTCQGCAYDMGDCPRRLIRRSPRGNQQAPLAARSAGCAGRWSRGVPRDEPGTVVGR